MNRKKKSTQNDLFLSDSNMGAEAVGLYMPLPVPPLALLLHSICFYSSYPTNQIGNSYPLPRSTCIVSTDTLI